MEPPVGNRGKCVMSSIQPNMDLFLSDSRRERHNTIRATADDLPEASGLVWGCECVSLIQEGNRGALKQKTKETVQCEIQYNVSRDWRTQNPAGGELG